MITGNDPASAKAVREMIGITTERVVTGRELEQLLSERARDLVREVDIFARVAPVHKLRLAEALKDNGEIVAVTRDGVNDAPALKRSDEGVAMDLRRRHVTRDVADIDLRDDNFAAIVAAVFIWFSRSFPSLEASISFSKTRWKPLLEPWINAQLWC